MLQDILAAVGGIGLLASAFVGIVTGIRSLKRGPKEDQGLEADIQNRITTMARDWLAEADKRLQAAVASAESAESRAEKAERTAERMEGRVVDLERNLMDALGAVDVLYPWGMNGGGEPVPRMAAWIVERLHSGGHGG